MSQDHRRTRGPALEPWQRYGRLGEQRGLSRVEERADGRRGPDRREHLVEVGRPPRRLILGHAVEELVQGIRNPVDDLARQRRASARQIPDEHLIEHDASRIDVARRPRIDASSEHLRGHVPDRAVADIGLFDLHAVALDDPCQTEVNQLDVPRAVEEDVLRLQIPVKQSMLMSRAEPERDLNNITDRDRRR